MKRKFTVEALKQGHPFIYDPCSYMGCKAENCEMHGFHQLCKTGVLAHHTLIAHIDSLHGIADPLDDRNSWLNKLFGIMKANNSLKHVADVMIEKIEKKKKHIRHGMFGSRRSR